MFQAVKREAALPVDDPSDMARRINPCQALSSADLLRGGPTLWRSGAAVPGWSAWAGDGRPSALSCTPEASWRRRAVLTSTSWRCRGKRLSHASGHGQPRRSHRIADALM